MVSPPTENSAAKTSSASVFDNPFFEHDQQTKNSMDSAAKSYSSSDGLPQEDGIDEFSSASLLRVYVEKPEENDVMFMPDGSLKGNPGKERYVDTVKGNACWFNAISIDDKLPQATVNFNKAHRAKIAKMVVDVVLEGGQFLQEDYQGRFYVLDNKQACDKTSLALSLMTPSSKTDQGCVDMSRKRHLPEDQVEFVHKEGRFLQEGPQGHWYILDEDETFQKTSQSLGGNQEDLIPNSKTTLPNKTAHDVNAADEYEGEAGGPYGGSPSPAVSVEAVEPKKTRQKKRKEPEQIIYVKVPTENDVLFGRGSKRYNREGNRRYLKKVKELRPEYADVDNNNAYPSIFKKKEKKTELSRAVVDFVHNSNGRFLQRENKDGEERWYIVHHDTARFKASQALRDKKKQASLFNVMCDSTLPTPETPLK